MSARGQSGSAREEAERLIATVLAAATIAARPSGGSGPGPGNLGAAGLGGLWSALGAAQRILGNPELATGEPACCVCPVCRLISAMRDPSPEFAERLATGAGDVATGVAGIMRAFGGAGRGAADDAGARRGEAGDSGAVSAAGDSGAVSAAGDSGAVPAAGDSGAVSAAGDSGAVPAAEDSGAGPAAWREEDADPAEADPGAGAHPAGPAGPAAAGGSPGGPGGDVWHRATRAAGESSAPHEQPSRHAAAETMQPATPPGESR